MPGSGEMSSASRRLNIKGLRDIFYSPISIMLICVPFGILSPYLGWAASWTFWLNFCAMIPLAKILGDATEELALSLKNDMLSGLLNATFGNAVEMIMTITFLRNHEYVVVKSSMLGSVLSNMLLVLGMSFFVGGLINHKKPAASSPSGRTLTPSSIEQPFLANEQEQTYSQVGAIVNTTMLLLSCLILCLVTVFDCTTNVDNADHPQSPADDKNILPISRVCAVAIIMAYVAYIIFELFTHKKTIGDADGGGDEEEEEASLSQRWALGLLLVATLVVAVCSEFLTGALEGALQGSGMGREFLGIILLPIVGNACEHVSAIRFAMQDKAGLSVGIAIGSSVQISLFVTPFAVLIGWAMGDDPHGGNMDLNFGALNVAVLTMSVLVVLAIVVDGKSNWLEGYMLCTAYFMIAVLYWFVPDTDGAPKQ